MIGIGMNDIRKGRVVFDGDVLGLGYAYLLAIMMCICVVLPYLHLRQLGSDFTVLVGAAAATGVFFSIWRWYFYQKSIMKLHKVMSAVALAYGLPFLNTIFIFMDQSSSLLLANLALSIFLLSAISRGEEFVLITLFGVIAGVSYLTFIQNIDLSLNLDRVWEFLYTVVVAIIVGIIFLKRSDIYSTIKVKSYYAKALTTAIAHEVKSPISGAAMNMEVVKILLETEIANRDQQKNKGAKKHKEMQEAVDLGNALNFVKESLFSARRGAQCIDIILAATHYEQIQYKNIDKEKEFIVASIKNTIETACHEIKETHPMFADRIKIISYENDFSYSGNVEAMKYVIINLVKNAIRYALKSREDCVLNIEIRNMQAGYNYVTFTDDGPGMSKEKIKEVFRNGFNSGGVGTGLGLAYCKMVMRDLGGDIECESALGKGCSFTLKFAKLS